MPAKSGENMGKWASCRGGTVTVRVTLADTRHDEGNGTTRCRFLN
jgi:hypothetical protein